MRFPEEDITGFYIENVVKWQGFRFCSLPCSWCSTWKEW